jgi:hypothetical protein
VFDVCYDVLTGNDAQFNQLDSFTFTFIILPSESRNAVYFRYKNQSQSKEQSGESPKSFLFLERVSCRHALHPLVALLTHPYCIEFAPQSIIDPFRVLLICLTLDVMIQVSSFPVVSSP